MTSGVLRGNVSVPDIVRRRLARPARPTPEFWLVAILVTGIGLLLRLLNVAHPAQIMFDETYYANEARDLLQHGVEWNPDENSPQYVVHPPLGKWMIGAGEQLFGYNSFGWRIAAVAVGTLSILLIILAARRLFRSTILAGTAGLLMSLDGMHFVLSRAALLDIFLMFWIVVAFYFLVLDREQRRARWLTLLETGAEPVKARLGIPWYRVACAVSLGLACGVKWSGIYYLVLFAVAAVVFDLGARRSAGARRWLRDGLADGAGWLAAFLAIALVAYLGTWWGWFASDDGYFRHWYAQTNGLPHDRLIDPLVNLLHYHHDAYRFHVGLSTKHPYQSWPWQWLLLGRPVLFHSDVSGTSCGAEQCVSQVVLLGTPVLWWSFLPALAALGWLAVARRDGRAWLIMAAALTGILPWFQEMPEHRTMFYFYALPAEPFLVLAVVYVLGAIIGPARHLRPDSDRRLLGSLAAGAYVLLVAACFAYFYPLYTGTEITNAQWLARMWLGSRWV